MYLIGAVAGGAVPIITTALLAATELRLLGRAVCLRLHGRKHGHDRHAA